MMEFLITLLTGVGIGALLTLAPKAHKEAEEKYWLGLEKYRVDQEQQ